MDHFLEIFSQVVTWKRDDRSSMWDLGMSWRMSVLDVCVLFGKTGLTWTLIVSKLATWLPSQILEKF